MGEVYEVEDLRLHERLALKTIRAENARDSKANERFVREIQLARKVTHPNVCRIFDIGFHKTSSKGDAEQLAEEVMFLTMELLPGETLGRRIARGGRMAPAEALPIVAQIASGLAAAHAAEIIHRDFKSSNVVLVPPSSSRQGIRPVITDFGLARHQETEDGSNTSISGTGFVVGTPAYMAPEQVQGLDLTPAADIYALGIVLYEMVTGLRPFDGGSAISVAVRRLTETPPSPRKYVPDLDPGWESAILRCLERSPGDRFASAGDLVKELSGEAVRPASRALLQPGRRGQRRLAALFAAAGLVLVAGTGWYLAGRRPASHGVPAGTADSRQPPRGPVAARRSVAVLGFKNVSGRADSAWLSTAVSEMLATELAAGDVVRVVPADEVARFKLDLGLADAENLPPEALQRIPTTLRANLVVFGSYTVLAGEQSRLVRIDLRLEDIVRGETVASAGATGSEAQLFDLVSRAAATLRQKLGLGELSPAQTVAMQAALPSNPESARLYMEGLAHMRVLDVLPAVELLEKAVVADPKHPLPHAALAEAWSALGYEGRARAEAKKAADLAQGLPKEAGLLIEARLHETDKNWEKAIQTYQRLFQSYPDSLEYGLRLASAQTQGGSPNDALLTVQTLRQMPAPAAGDPRIDLTEARAFQTLGDATRQRKLAATAAASAKAIGARRLEAQARGLEVTALDVLGQPSAAAAAAEAARALYAEIGDRGGTARTLEQIAILQWRRGDVQGAMRLFEKALATHRELGDKSSTARVAHNMGNLLLGQGKLAEATRNYQESLSIFHAIGAKYEEARTLSDLGAGLYNQGELAQAQKRYEQALAVFGEIGEKAGVAMALTNIAEVLYAQGNLNHAESTHQESLAINREIGDKAAIAYDMFRLGEVSAAKGDLAVAKDRYQEALVIQDALGERTSAAQTRLSLAALMIEQGRAAEAETLARQAEEVVRTEKAADLEAWAQIMIGRSLLPQAKLDEARAASGRLEGLAAKSEDRRVRMAAAILAARVRGSSGGAEAIAALTAVQKALNDAAKAGLVDQQLEARLAIGELEMLSGKATAVGRLTALQKDAEQQGFGLIARKAGSMLSAKVASK